MGLDGEHQDGMIAKYLISKGLPESIQITSKRLARFCTSCLPSAVLANFSHAELKEISLKGYTRKLMMKARDDLRNAYKAKQVVANGRIYRVMRVEDWPEYHIALEIEGLDNNGRS